MKDLDQEDKKISIKGQMSMAVLVMIEEGERQMRYLQRTEETATTHVFLLGYCAGIRALQDIVLKLER